jgi:steroid 5-alpha reductase family enzyme
MWKTALFLLVTIVVIPVAAFAIDEPLEPLQKSTLITLVTVYVIAAMLCFILSTATNNYSQVDKLWSIMPLIYTWIIAYQSDWEPRLLLMAIVVSIWGLRLTYNFSRRGGYSLRFWTGEEDYRWPILRQRPEFSDRWKWSLFNLFFISLYQMGLILMMTLPALKSMGGGPLRWIDFLLAGLVVGLVVIETIADQQQWNFQHEKYRLKRSGKSLPPPYDKGFLDTGLWGMVRHPNYSAEQAVWIVFYFFSVSATGLWLNWSVTGAILLVLLFFGSSNFSESISAGKYPEYTIYQKRVPRFIPFPKSNVVVEEGRRDPA